ncbi:hypothetical protein M413DRAFT_444301 [Hebeloma cylindrosporum]|uniref:PLAC8 family protein n=1 Tax=Hebeloma cylindrosporum TaxID=76867 RepID=A0A0C3CEJ0_HEBCY|nr:hypothetical protein M413DRAFT_444301 [Hebeloma cylindrosporum h7]
MSIPRDGNRNVRGLPYDEEGKREWSHDLFDCLGDIDTCLLAWCCPCLAHGRNRRRLNHLNMHGVPDPDRRRVTAGDSIVYAALEAACNMGWLLQIATRRDIRQRYGIRGTESSDFCTPFCCQACDLVQGSRELQLEEEVFDTFPQYGST